MQKQLRGCVVGGLLCLQGTVALAATSPDSLLAVDQNRSEIVSGLVEKWKDHLNLGKADELRKTLMGLRADRLLTVSLAQDQKQFAALLEKDDFLPVKSESPAQAAGQDRVGYAKALGDPNTDVVYVPVTPCRLFYTEISSGGAGGALLPGVTRTFNTRGSLTGQGGAAGCELPATATAAVVQMGAFSSFGLGWINAGPQGSPIPSGVLLAYNNVAFINATSVVIKLNPANGQFSAFSNNNRTELYGDVLGYFARPTNYAGTITATGIASTVNGGRDNSTAGDYSTIGGGGGTGSVAIPAIETITLTGNQILGAATSATISGGSGNLVQYNATTFPVFASIGGGQNNKAYAYFGTIAGGRGNVAGQVGANTIGGTVGGGFGNFAFSDYAAIAGGSNNQAGPWAAVPGGASNLALGAYSLAAGRQAFSSNDTVGTTRYAGTFVWADSNANAGAGQNFFASAQDQFAVRSRGGVVFKVAAAASAADGAAGCSIPAGGAASWSCSSDRNLKDGVVPVAVRDVLSKVIAMPLSTWQFKGTDRRHLSPMAQDFWAAFGLGENDRTITASDVSGVALAAIQGLNQKLEDEKRTSRVKDAKINKLERELAAIKKKLGM